MLGCENCMNYPVCDNEDKGTRCEAYEPKSKICCICGCKFDGWGNDPYPVKEDGECCDLCNSMYVIPARLKAFVKGEKENGR